MKTFLKVFTALLVVFALGSCVDSCKTEDHPTSTDNTETPADTTVVDTTVNDTVD